MQSEYIKQHLCLIILRCAHQRKKKIYKALYLFQFKMGIVQFKMGVVQFKMGIVQFKIF